MNLRLLFHFCIVCTMNDLDIRTHLAAAFQLIAHFGYDDLTFTHLSARCADGKSFFIQPFGQLFFEVTASSLLKVDFEGQILEGIEEHYNPTGYVLHTAIYQARPDINAVFHLHTEAGIAVSTLVEGLLPISQWALHFYDQVSYHTYDSLTLTHQQHEDPLVKSLGKNNVMFLRNHGTLLCGRTIHEAFIYQHHLERACRTQIQALSTGRKLIMPDEAICKKTVHDLLSFEKDIGQRDWQALLRLLEKTNNHYKD